MGSDKLRVYEAPELRDSRLLMGLSGWMDGAEVSTGTIKVLIDKLHAQRIAEQYGADAINALNGLALEPAAKSDLRELAAFIVSRDF